MLLLLRSAPERSIITILYGEVSIKQFLTDTESVDVDNRLRVTLTLCVFDIKLDAVSRRK